MLWRNHTLRGKNQESTKWDRRTFFTKVLNYMELDNIINHPLVIQPRRSLNLNLLDLRQNKISSLRVSTFISIKIKRLSLSDNNLEDFQMIYDKINLGCTELILSNNFIKNLRFVKNMEPLPSYLDVANNSIHDIDESLTEKLSHINRLNLSGNPWKCSCKSRDRFLIDFLLSLAVQKNASVLPQISKITTLSQWTAAHARWSNCHYVYLLIRSNWSMQTTAWVF